MLQPRIAGKAIDFATVSYVADEFSTSLTAAAIRVVELSALPAMLVCTERYRRRWFVKSKDVPSWLWPRATPTTDSVARDLFATNEKRGAATVVADAWFDHAESERYELAEDARRLGDYVLSLLSWPNEDHLVALHNGTIHIPYSR